MKFNENLRNKKNIQRMRRSLIALFPQRTPFSSTQWISSHATFFWQFRRCALREIAKKKEEREEAIKITPN
jgi:hypothetical protein